MSCKVIMSMKVLMLLTLGVIMDKADALNQSECDEYWKAYKDACGKSYPDPLHESFRKDLFLLNLGKINQHNAEYSQGKWQYQVSLTCMGSDWARNEFKSLMQGYIITFEKTGIKLDDTWPHLPKTVPPALDWRPHLPFSLVTHQKFCAGSYALQTVKMIESSCFIKHKKIVTLSAQEIIDCSEEFNNLGCDGGRPDWALQYIKKYGIGSEKDYPFTGVKGKCRRSSVPRTKVNVTGYYEPTECQEDLLVKILNHFGPVAAVIDGSSWRVQHFKSGVYSDSLCSAFDLNLVMLVVAYGEEKGQKYWVLASPFGRGWGESGYMKIVRNKGNQCGVATETIAAVVTQC